MWIVERVHGDALVADVRLGVGDPEDRDAGRLD
jgi:hypothetical protein